MTLSVCFPYLIKHGKITVFGVNQSLDYPVFLVLAAYSYGYDSFL